MQLQEHIAYSLEQIKRRLSMPDSTVQIQNSVMYLPNYPWDLIQRAIVESDNYWDIAALAVINKYLKDNAVILDIGANIGNHTLYWAIEKHAKKIYSFEPIKSIYDILLKNIEINNLADVVIPYNVGLYDENTKGSIKLYNADNIGGTNVKKDPNGNIELITLDSLKIKDKIDLVKIDAEWLEVEVLMGSLKTLKKNKPVIIIETYEKNQQIVHTILTELGYIKAEMITEVDFIYKWAGKKDV